MPENADTARSCILQGYEIVLVTVRPVIPVLQILNSNFARFGGWRRRQVPTRLARRAYVRRGGFRVEYRQQP
jgi:hypothetical protein